MWDNIQHFKGLGCEEEEKKKKERERIAFVDLK